MVEQDAARRQCVPRMERQGGAAGLANRRAPSQGARAPDRKGGPKGRRSAAPRGALPALHSPLGDKEKGKTGLPGAAKNTGDDVRPLVIPGREQSERTRNPEMQARRSGFRVHRFAVSRNDEEKIGYLKTESEISPPSS